jgi:hypothetical protein
MQFPRRESKNLCSFQYFGKGSHESGSSTDFAMSASLTSLRAMSAAEPPSWKISVLVSNVTKVL